MAAICSVCAEPFTRQVREFASDLASLAGVNKLAGAAS
jgi:hypothetical protein